jgi:hypothetical protein
MNSIHGWNSSPRCKNRKDGFQKLCKVKRKLISRLLRPVFQKKVVLARVAVNFPHFCIWAMPSPNIDNVTDWVTILHRATWFCRWLVFDRCPVLMSAGTPTILTEVYYGFPQSLQPNSALVPSVRSPSLSPYPIQFIDQPVIPCCVVWQGEKIVKL